MPFSKNVIIWSGLCFLGLSAATALYKRKELLYRFNWLNDNQEDKPTSEETSLAKSETSPAKSDVDIIHANDSTNNVTDSDSFFSFTSECDGVCCNADLTDSSSSCGFEDTRKRRIVLKSGKQDLETDIQNSAFTNTLELDEQLSSPIVTSMEFQTPRRDVNENGVTCRRLDHVHNGTTSRQRGVIEDVPPSSPQSTYYSRIYDGYRCIVTPNSPTTMVFRANNK